jgi:DNA-binding transcriptional LysR family regulator
MNRLNVRQIEAFRAVMQLGNMTKAAEQLGISQPAVSRLLSDLQEAVGYPLFTRRRHGILPTEDARQLHHEVESVFIGLDELGRRALAIRNLEVGEIRIAAVSVYGNTLIPQIVSEFVHSHPSVNVSLDICRHDQVVNSLISRRSDVGLISGTEFCDNLAKQIFLTRPALCALPIGHRLAVKDVIHASDLRGESFISFPRDATFRYRVDSLFERANVERDLRFDAGTHEAVCNFVSQGLGVSVISPFTGALRTRIPIITRPFVPSLDLDIGVITDEANMSSATQIFLRFLVDWFSRNSDNIVEPQSSEFRERHRA